MSLNLQNIEAMISQSKTVVDTPPTHNIQRRHPLTYADFWCFAAALVCVMLTTTSQIPFKYFELFTYGAIVFGICGLILNTTRDASLETQVFIQVQAPPKRPTRVKMDAPPKNAFAEAQVRMGIDPIIHPEQKPN